MDNMTPADISALMNGNGNCGGAWWLILLFLFIGGNGWNRNGDLGQYATAASQQEILFGQKFNMLEQKADSINNGICSATYALNNAIAGEGRGLQAQIAESTCKIENAIRNDGEATRGLINQNLVQQLRDRVAALEADARVCNVVRYPTYATTNSPLCNYNNGCNCNGNI